MVAEKMVSIGLLCVLVFLGTTGLHAEKRKGNMLDIYSPVKVNSSSTLSEKNKAFDPQLAIQADTNSVLDSCFISKKEINPWYTLQFTNVTSVFNVRLGVKIRENGTLETFKLRMMNNLTVYVRQSLELARNSQQICGSPWRFNRTLFIMFTCERVLKGRFLDITVDSSKLSQLLICSIVINIENGIDSPLNFTEERATVTSSGRRNSDPPLDLAIDGNRKSCSLLSGRVKTWLRIDVQTVRYIKKLRVFFDKATETRTTIFIGRSLQSHGSKGNELCGNFGKIKKRKKLLTCEQPILGQFIYIESNSRSVNICEIEVYYDTFLNIYSSVIITASGQRYENSSIWKPIDGIRRGSFAASWISVESKLSWWQMEFPQENVISHAVINTPFLNILMRRKMLTSNIYIGNFPHDHISDNAMCEGPWSYTDNSQAKNCAGHPAGKYFIIRGWNLFIEEITLYDCEEPEVQITTFPSDQVQQEKSVDVTCQFSLKGCKVESVTWVDPNGKKITTAKNNSLDGKPASTISIKNDSFYRQFICTFEYGMKSVAKQYRVRPILYVPNYTVKGSSGRTATLQVMLTVQNSIIEHQNTWTRNDDRLQQGEKYSFSTDGMTLTINNLLLNDCGNYTFTFNSDFYGNSTATIMLIVYERPSIVQQQSYENLSEGETVVVICKARSCIVDPQKISFQWQRNGELLANDDRTNISSIINMTLMILNVSKAEEGNYTCIAVSNAWNITSDAVAVTVKECPAGTPSSGIKVHTFTSSKSAITTLYTLESTIPRATTVTLWPRTTRHETTYIHGQRTSLLQHPPIASTPLPQAHYPLTTSSSGTTFTTIAVVSSSIAIYSTVSLTPANTLRSSFAVTISHVPTAQTSKTSSSASTVPAKDMSSAVISTPVQTVSPQFLSSPKNLTVAEGRQAILQCSVSGFPLPTITWIKISNQTAATSVISEYGQSMLASTARWLKVKRSASGEYLCKADNGIGNSVFSDKAYLDVQYAPQFTSHPSSKTLKSSGEFHLHCSAEGNPQPMVTWMMAPFSAKVDPDAAQNISRTWQLTIQMAITDDSGFYRCLVWNKLGRSYSKWATVIVQDRPSAIQIIDISRIGDRSATVQWRRPFNGYSNITRYIIYFQENCTDNTRMKKIVRYDVSKTVLRGLRPQTQYCISIRAFNGLGGGKRSSIFKIMTVATESPGRVRNVVLTPLSSVEISVKWKEPINSKTTISIFRVYYSTVYDDNIRKQAEVKSYVVVQGNITSTVLRDLKKYTWYNVTVVAVTITHGVSTYGEMSIPVSAMTLEDAPSAPINVSIASIPSNPHQLLITWSRPLHPNGIIREYIVNYRKSGEDTHLRKLLVVSGTSEKVILDELEPYTVYLIFVQAYTNKGGNLSNVVSGKTEEGKPSAPISFTSIYVTHNSTLLTWNPPMNPRGQVTKYEIFYSGKKSFIEEGEEQEASVNKTIILNHPKDLQITINDLIPDTTFTFIVVAFTTIGSGEKATLRLKTEIDWPVQPKIPTNQEYLRIASPRVEVKLVQPSNRNGAITHVDLLIVKLTSGTGLFHGTPMNYTNSFAGTLFYITARFKYEEIPNTFIIGDEKWYGGYFNGPLERDFPYLYALRSYSVTKSNRILFSTSQNIYFYFESKDADSDTEGTTVIVSVVTVVGAVIVFIIVIVAVKICRRGLRANSSTSGKDSEVQKNEGNKETKSLDHSVTTSSLYVQSTDFSAPKDTVFSTLTPPDTYPDHLYESIKMVVQTPSEAIHSEISCVSGQDEAPVNITYESVLTTDVDS